MIQRDSRSFILTQCVRDTAYCDVAEDHWAYPEITSWYERNISNGCRSGTEIFYNRPFCPEMVVERWALVFFVLHYLEGGDFRPLESYQGNYDDVPEGLPHQQELWIEEFTQRGLEMPSANYVPSEQGEVFCPYLPVRKGELLVLLAQVLDWELTSSPAQVFADVSADTKEGQILAYMWKQGYVLPSDSNCPDIGTGLRFCPDNYLRRAEAAFMMARSFGDVPSVPNP